jgi:hypothetical protein
MKMEDMRAKEDFQAGDQVKVIDRNITGRILKFDPDMRLAQVDTWSAGKGWWYLKDLEVKSGR